MSAPNGRPLICEEHIILKWAIDNEVFKTSKYVRAYSKMCYLNDSQIKLDIYRCTLKILVLYTYTRT